MGGGNPIGKDGVGTPIMGLGPLGGEWGPHREGWGGGIGNPVMGGETLRVGMGDPRGGEPHREGWGGGSGPP